jgi:hypothetical protein
MDLFEVLTPVAITAIISQTPVLSRSTLGKTVNRHAIRNDVSGLPFLLPVVVYSDKNVLTVMRTAGRFLAVL